MTPHQDDFDWNSDESVVVRHQPAVAVYLNERGEVVIRQQDDYGDGDIFIVLSRANVPVVITLMRLLADGDAEPKPEPMTAAEKQKRYRDKKRGNADGADGNADGNDGNAAEPEPEPVIDLLSRTRPRLAEKATADHE